MEIVNSSVIIDIDMQNLREVKVMFKKNKICVRQKRHINLNNINYWTKNGVQYYHNNTCHFDFPTISFAIYNSNIGARVRRSSK